MSTRHHRPSPCLCVCKKTKTCSVCVLVAVRSVSPRRVAHVPSVPSWTTRAGLDNPLGRQQPVGNPPTFRAPFLSALSSRSPPPRMDPPQKHQPSPTQASMAAPAPQYYAPPPPAGPYGPGTPYMQPTYGAPPPAGMGPPPPQQQYAYAAYQREHERACWLVATRGARASQLARMPNSPRERGEPGVCSVAAGRPCAPPPPSSRGRWPGR